MKKTIMLFAGTTEGRRICEFLAVKKEYKKLIY